MRRHDRRLDEWELEMDLIYLGLALMFALLTFFLIEGCRRLRGES